MSKYVLDDFLGTGVLDALHRPIKEAKGLPRIVYTDEEFYRFEEEALFPKQWMGVAFAARIPDSGDALPLSVAGQPIVLVRGEGGDVRAFHNVCRHRGTIIVPESLKRAHTLRCAYHSWTWDLEGNLRSRPSWDGREDEAEDRLLEVRCKVWCGVVFVTLSKDTLPFDQHFEFLQERWKNYDFDALAPFAMREWPIQTNWKLHALGVIEPYHEPFIHPQIVNTVNDGETGEKKLDNDTFTTHLETNCIGLGTPGNDRTYNWTGDFPLLPGPSDDVVRDLDIFLLYPNTTIAIVPEHLLAMTCTPLDANRSRVDVALMVERAAATDPAFAKDREGLLADYVLTIEQDVAVLELQQAGHASPVSDDSKFSPFWESTVLYFESRVIEDLGQGTSGASLQI